jgi:hypothetical protein
MTLYVGLRNYSDTASGLRVRKGEPVELSEADAARLPGDVLGPSTGTWVVHPTKPDPAPASPRPAPGHQPDAAPELDIEIDLGADDLSQKPNRKRTAQKDRT